ncbi:hypothetical protein JWG44_05370 [Leptospira sp. 201903071]|uniref:hypothetical protein n=1 Tax=Leptospira ainazelensis TaxID=2810034 RepID=UPI001964AC8E|nr:hypothetical protein [Leptospira ainazelensis]MBM9499679.1 hypothetical protein [Leptospira ainazelensis]
MFNWYEEQLDSIDASCSWDLNQNGIKIPLDVRKFSNPWEQKYYLKLLDIKEKIARLKKERPDARIRRKVVLDTMALNREYNEYQDCESALSRLLHDIQSGQIQVVGMLLISIKSIVGEMVIDLEGSGLSREERIELLEEAIEIEKREGGKWN